MYILRLKSLVENDLLILLKGHYKVNSLKRYIY